MVILSILFVPGILAATILTASNQTCKTTPLDTNWPSAEEWAALDTAIGGVLIKTAPIASSCYPGNTFNSPLSCDTVAANWTSSTFHTLIPESIDYPTFANNSCLPKDASGYFQGRGCEVGGMPQYIVNATTEDQIATAMSWAAARNIRITIKGTGHEMNGRSSGAYSMLIWTRNFQNLEFNSTWSLPNSSVVENIVIAGSGNSWNSVYTGASDVGRIAVGGGAKSVGLGGFIQGGGHGPLSSHYGLAADQILQVTVVTTEGKILVANAQQNQDMLFAIRGGGAGQYGVVTEYVLKTYPVPTTMVAGTLTLSSNGTDSASSDASWRAFAAHVASLPDLMDLGLAGSVTATTDNGTITATNALFGYNITSDEMRALVEPVMARMQTEGNSTTLSVELTDLNDFETWPTFFEYIKQVDNVAGGGSAMSSRLLGRAQLNITSAELITNLKKVMVTESSNNTGGYIIIGMQGGLGPANVPEEMRGALQPSWRTAYLHTITIGATINATADSQTTLDSAAKWLEGVPEPVWREWAPEMGSYMNEGNPFNTEFKHDYYGKNYDRLVDIKLKYDPTESLFVLTGVNSDKWNYNLNSGKLCRV
ncbi:FAD binding domain protein [Hyaloscypha variabilis]